MLTSPNYVPSCIIVVFLTISYFHLTEGKTSVIISHRVGLSRFADRIIVMQDGCVVGNGTHEELLGNNDEYKRIWNEQAKWYAG